MEVCDAIIIFWLAIVSDRYILFIQWEYGNWAIYISNANGSYRKPN